jgi:hypothetical protein
MIDPAGGGLGYIVDNFKKKYEQSLRTKKNPYISRFISSEMQILILLNSII